MDVFALEKEKLTYQPGVYTDTNDPVSRFVQRMGRRTSCVRRLFRRRFKRLVADRCQSPQNDVRGRQVEHDADTALAFDTADQFRRRDADQVLRPQPLKDVTVLDRVVA